MTTKDSDQKIFRTRVNLVLDRVREYTETRSHLPEGAFVEEWVPFV